ncbi:hypothetical protein [Halomonas korlensis]|uniref:Uncharacterized protein n=1 Tax=Halomonas korlensis TaxID=463301 RepID=A0A1I7KM39_9GAMM|nr:hypothetical protein [Halomonas korlensis]SFU98503.1 hypothetical protein SAMN04487955_12616 [Halomonas korlensis]
MKFMQFLSDLVVMVGALPPESLVVMVTFAALAVVFQALRVVIRALDRRND